jgi:hypothetical protein
MALPRPARTVALDLLLPLVLSVGVAATAFRDAITRLDAVVIGPLGDCVPGDLNGTVWFYGWMERAVRLGLPILNTNWVSWPGGQRLGRVYPNRIDAWLALPFVHFLPFPVGFDVFLLLIPVFGTLASYAFFRALTAERWLALSAAFIVGFQQYTFYELAGGRPVTALFAVVPLFLAAWWRALGMPRLGPALAWAGAAGGIAALVARSYVPWVLWTGALAVVLAGARTFTPAPGVSRSRPLVVSLVALAIALPLAVPYLHELWFVRTGLAGAGGDPLPPWDFRVWRDVAAGISERLTGPPTAAPVHVAAPAAGLTSNDAWLPFLPNGFFVVVLGACVLGGRAGFGWGLVGYAFWLTLRRDSLALQLPGPAQLWLRYLPTTPGPARVLMDTFPTVGEFVRPYRGAPIASLALVAALVSGWEGFARRTRGLSGGLARAGRLLRIGGGAAVVALGVTTCLDAVRVEVPRVMLTAWRPSPFYAQLAADPAPGAVIDLPLGLGHALGPTQVLHGRPRADTAADDLGRPLTDTSQVPQPWLRPFRAFGTPGAPEPPPTALDEARGDGFAWIIVHLHGYDELAKHGLKSDPAPVLAWLTNHVGPPRYSDDEVVAYALGAPG